MRLWMAIGLAALPGLTAAALPGRSTLGYFPEDFFAPVPDSAPVLSPDGRRVAYVRMERHRQQVEVHELDGGGSRLLHRLGGADDTLTTLGWVGDDLLYWQQNHASVWAMGLDEAVPRRIFASGRVYIGYGFVFMGDLIPPQVVGVLKTEPDTLQVAMPNARGRMEIFRINARTGEQKLDFSTGPQYRPFFTDALGRIRAAYFHDRREAALHWRDPRSGKWRDLQRQLPPRTPLRFRYSGASLAGRPYHFLGIGADETEIYFATNHLGDTTAVYRLDLQQGNWAEVASDPRYDLVTLPGAGEQRVWDRRTQRLAGVHYQADEPRTIWLLPEYQAVQEAIDALQPARWNRILDADAAHRAFLVHSQSNRDKGRFMVFNPESGSLKQVGEVDRRVRAADMAPMDSVAFTARDGARIEGYLTRPLPERRAAGLERLPLVVLIHGGPWVRDFNRFDPEVQFLAYHGFAVLQVNFRGSDGYGFAHMDALRGDFGEPALRDLEDALAWALDSGEFDPARVAAMGGSYGAYAAVWSLLRRPGCFAAGVALSGVYDLEAHLAHLAKSPGKRAGYDFWSEMVGTQWQRPALRRMSPLHEAERLRVPLLLLHGEADTRVPAAQTRQLAGRLRELGIGGVEEIYLKEMGHGFARQREVAHAYERILAFLRKHLLAAAQP